VKRRAAKLGREAVRAGARGRRVLLSLLILAGLAIAGAPVGWAQSPVSGARAGMPLAVSDFDGDLRPDVATVEAGRSDLALTDYWVELQLTMSGTQAIRVVGPTGGLQVAVRDVNGDQIPDLVLTTAWRGQPVAILLNDGHGSFSRAEPEEFPDAFRASPDGWGGTEMPRPTAAASLSESRFGAEVSEVRLAYRDAASRPVQRSNPEDASDDNRLQQRGRAPPFAIPSL
jgi:hypothetical protein